MTAPTGAVREMAGRLPALQRASRLSLQGCQAVAIRIPRPFILHFAFRQQVRVAGGHWPPLRVQCGKWRADCPRYRELPVCHCEAVRPWQSASPVLSFRILHSAFCIPSAGAGCGLPMTAPTVSGPSAGRRRYRLKSEECKAGTARRRVRGEKPRRRKLPQRWSDWKTRSPGRQAGA